MDDEAEISLLFVDNENIKELNKTYRDKDNKTDVLSFPLWDPEEELEEDEEFLLGDIVISLETALEQAEEYAHSLSREICYLFVHGLLHLIGYDHLTDEDKNIMRQQEEKILNSVEMPR
ncbi:rRNA maturation RNase YbeY [Desulfonispora thiosulfatigenes]|uniref:rRNA maturation RNase YbeY n=1 Tax=Desulfonispora thiosulfatigenes TaxID=83661 RepID=UPI003BFA7478